MGQATRRADEVGDGPSHRRRARPGDRRSSRGARRAVGGGVRSSTRWAGRHPGGTPVLPDAIEAAAAAGAAERAAELLVELDAQVGRARRALGPRRGAAGAGRGRPPSRATRQAPSTLAAAVDAFDAVGARLDAARACWWRGRALRGLGPPPRGGRGARRGAPAVRGDGRRAVGATGRRRVGTGGARPGVERPDRRRAGCRRRGSPPGSATGRSPPPCT